MAKTLEERIGEILREDDGFLCPNYLKDKIITTVSRALTKLVNKLDTWEEARRYTDCDGGFQALAGRVIFVEDLFTALAKLLEKKHE